MRRVTTVATLAVTALLSCTPVAKLQERAPLGAGWEGERNRIEGQVHPKRQEFGYIAPTQGGQGREGRIGGVVWRSIEPAHYGKPVGSFSFEDPLSCSGTLWLHNATATMGWQNGSTVFIGFFNHREQGWRPVNFVGFRLEGYNEPDGATVEVSYGTSMWCAGGAFINAAGGVQQRQVSELESAKLLRVAPDAKPHRWSLKYEPEGDGGVIRFVFDGAESVVRVAVEHRKQGAAFDRFGIFNAQMPGKSMEAEIGDLTINEVRENLAVDPNWEERGNRRMIEDKLAYGINDFGYSAVEKAIGGRLWRVEKSEPQFKGWYGKRVGKLTLDNRLVARGRLRVLRFCVDSGMHFGWFNSREQGWPPKNFVGVYLDSLSSKGRFITPMYGTRDARLVIGEDGRKSFIGAAHGEERLLFFPDGRIYRWQLEYDPQGGGGVGAISLRLGNELYVMRLKPGDRALGAAFDRLGLFNMQDNNGKDCIIYLDELSYTVAP